MTETTSDPLFKLPALPSDIPEGDSSSNKASDLPKKETPTIQYTEPSWSGSVPAEKGYKIEVLKNGTIADVFELKDKTHFVIGRLPTVDIPMEHPSLSRFHAVLQYNPNKGFFLYDLDSTHGTFHNKKRVISRVFVPLKVGHGIKLGGSTRLLILQGPDEDMEDEISMEEMREMARKKKEKEELRKQIEMEDERRKKEEEEEEERRGISWGMREDAVQDEEETEAVNPFSQENENLYLDDPKKSLKGWFDREGFELDYKLEEKGYATFTCSIDLPLESGKVVAQATVKGGKKKEAVVQCALEACRILDRHGLFRSSHHVSKAKKNTKNWEEDDFYASDEDEFLDRTGNIQTKRLQRMKMMSKDANISQTVETYESLKLKFERGQAEIKRLEEDIQKSKKTADKEFEDYMEVVEGTLDKQSLIKLKTQLSALKVESVRLSKLMAIAKPTSLPALKAETKIHVGAMIGKRGTGGIFGKTRTVHKPEKNSPVTNETTAVTKASETEKLEDVQTLQKVRDVNVKGIEKMEQNESSNAELNDNIREEKEITRKDNDVEDHNEPLQHKKRKRPKLSQPKSETEVKKEKENDDEERVKGAYSDSWIDPKYSTWTPPVNQTGDGRTSLNDKYGY